jgi:hypothetical protein
MPRQIRYRLPLNLVLHPPLTPTSACDRLPAPLAPMMRTVCKYGTSTLISRATTTEPKLFFQTADAEDRAHDSLIQSRPPVDVGGSLCC